MTHHRVQLLAQNADLLLARAHFLLEFLPLPVRLGLRLVR